MSESSQILKNSTPPLTAWERASGLTERGKQLRGERRKQYAAEKKEKEREDIKRNLERMVPEFGLSKTTHRALPFDMQERDGGIVKLPNGEEIRIDETVSPYLDKPVFTVHYHGKGKFESETYNSEEKAIEAQKRMYERHVAKIKKKYNL